MPPAFDPLANALSAPAATPETSPAPGRAMHILLAAPRGFCAGVDRAIKIVDLALEKFGAPVYIRHEIVHNRHVVDQLKAKGAIFVEELSEIPAGDRPVIFSAHGVPKSVPADALARRMFFLDATCPLVSKVHVEAERQHAEGRQIILIGHAGHPEVIGTMGQLPPGAVTLVQSIEDVEALPAEDGQRLAYVTQTTLSVDDTAAIVAALEMRFPGIAKPHKEDICYATTNRQEAVKAIVARAERLIVVGAPNSSNSVRLVELSTRAGCEAVLVQQASELSWAMFDGVSTIGITAGASAPEHLVQEVVAAFRQRFTVTIEDVVTRVERIAFNVPRVLRQPEASVDAPVVATTVVS